MYMSRSKKYNKIIFYIKSNENVHMNWYETSKLKNCFIFMDTAKRQL